MQNNKNNFIRSLEEHLLVLLWIQVIIGALLIEYNVHKLGYLLLSIGTQFAIVAMFLLQSNLFLHVFLVGSAYYSFKMNNFINVVADKTNNALDRDKMFQNILAPHINHIYFTVAYRTACLNFRKIWSTDNTLLYHVNKQTNWKTPWWKYTQQQNRWCCF